VEWSYPVAASVIRWPLRYRIDWRIEGLDRIPASGPVLIASNHSSSLDPLAIGYLGLLRQRRVRFLAKSELFSKPVLGALLRNGKQIPVQRHTIQAAEALVGGLDALTHGECVGVFPEGTISPDLNPIAGHTGTARLASLSGVPVLPMGLWGAHRAVTKGRGLDWRRRVPVTVVVGEFIDIAVDADIETATDRIMAAICTLVARARESYPDSDPSAWWYRAPEAAVLRSCRETR
jgi:1-acyl-sn-glycerol-3-phosphate acyltransferase